MSDVVLGELIDTPQHRDAVHVAIVPMKASELLRPGQRIGIISEGVAGPTNELVGIVDPYLTDVVPKGREFWMCLLPGTVTGMRHHWEHPAFSESPVVDERSASEVWLRSAAEKLGVDYESMIDEYGPLANGDYINNGEHIRDLFYDMQDDFWRHYVAVTGRDVPDGRKGGFTCSC